MNSGEFYHGTVPTDIYLLNIKADNWADKWDFANSNFELQGL